MPFSERLPILLQDRFVQYVNVHAIRKIIPDDADFEKVWNWKERWGHLGPTENK